MCRVCHFSLLDNPLRLKKNISLPFSYSPNRTAPQMTEMMMIIYGKTSLGHHLFVLDLFSFLVGDRWPLWAQMSQISGHVNQQTILARSELFFEQDFD